MRDVQIWIYVIGGAIYLISRALKKRQAAPSAPQQPKTERRFSSQGETQPAAPQKGLTFEELLREITEAKAPAKPVFQPAKSEYVDYDDDLKEEEQDLEDVSSDYRKKDKAFYDTYEEAKRQAFNRPSLEDTLKLKDTDMKFGKFKVFEEDTQSNLLNDYLKELKDPDGFKKAFVLSEVLQRRY
ncbi:MAG: hypothetical protein ABI663_21955 [Chryseolinea sp.]